MFLIISPPSPSPALSPFLSLPLHLACSMHIAPLYLYLSTSLYLPKMAMLFIQWAGAGVGLLTQSEPLNRFSATAQMSFNDDLIKAAFGLSSLSPLSLTLSSPLSPSLSL